MSSTSAVNQEEIAVRKISSEDTFSAHENPSASKQISAANCAAAGLRNILLLKQRIHSKSACSNSEVKCSTCVGKGKQGNSSFIGKGSKTRSLRSIVRDSCFLLTCTPRGAVKELNYNEQGKVYMPFGAACPHTAYTEVLDSIGEEDVLLLEKYMGKVLEESCMSFMTGIGIPQSDRVSEIIQFMAQELIDSNQMRESVCTEKLLKIVREHYVPCFTKLDNLTKLLRETNCFERNEGGESSIYETVFKQTHRLHAGVTCCEASTPEDTNSPFGHDPASSVSTHFFNENVELMEEVNYTTCVKGSMIIKCGDIVMNMDKDIVKRLLSYYFYSSRNTLNRKVGNLLRERRGKSISFAQKIDSALRRRLKL